MLLDYEYNKLNNAAILTKNREIARVLKGLETDLASVINHAKIKYPLDYAKRNVWQINTGLQTQVNKVLELYSGKIDASISEGISAQWALANDKNNLIVDQITSYTPLADPKIVASMQGLNLVALDQFISRKQAGLNLSQRVWNFGVTQNQELLETYLASGITRGRSAQKISQDIRGLLNEPDKLFRRVRNNKGELVLSEAAKKYHPGRGVYRSSARNARRLAATELNMAFHNSDFLRRQSLPFVKGVLVKLSSAHPIQDICDAMKGAYPKGFMFEGWHALCICYTTSIIPSRSEMIAFLKGEGLDQRKFIRSIPISAKGYIANHATSFNRMKNTPYFLEKNFTKDLKLKKAVTKR